VDAPTQDLIGLNVIGLFVTVMHLGCRFEAISTDLKHYHTISTLREAEPRRLHMVVSGWKSGQGGRLPPHSPPV
jgi:hypothetical protein